MRRRLAGSLEPPEIVLLWNFCGDRNAILGLCRERQLNSVWWEDGFFPHYETLHFDPVGFCWESSLPGMAFVQCTPRQRRRARAARRKWLANRNRGIVRGVSKTVRPLAAADSWRYGK